MKGADDQPPSGLAWEELEKWKKKKALIDEDDRSAPDPRDSSQPFFDMEGKPSSRGTLDQFIEEFGGSTTEPPYQWSMAKLEGMTGLTSSQSEMDKRAADAAAGRDARGDLERKALADERKRRAGDLATKKQKNDAVLQLKWDVENAEKVWDSYVGLEKRAKEILLDNIFVVASRPGASDMVKLQKERKRVGADQNEFVSPVDFSEWSSGDPNPPPGAERYLDYLAGGGRRKSTRRKSTRRKTKKRKSKRRKSRRKSC